MADGEGDRHTFKSDGLTLHYRKFGNPGGTPVILLHGLIYFSYDWVETANALAIDHQVVALDQRGFGDSEWSPTHDYAVAAFVRDVVNLVDELGCEKCILVGHSMGGRHAAATAVAHPDRIGGLILLNSPPLNAPHGARRVGDQLAGIPPVFATVDEALSYFPQTPYKDRFEPKRRRRFEAYLRPVAGGYVLKRDSYFHDLFRRMKETWPYHSYEYETWPMGKEFDAWKAWEELSMPTAIVVGVGGGDFFSPEMLARADILATNNKNLKVMPIIGMHHNIPGKDPALIADIVRDVIARAKGNVDQQPAM